MPAGFADLDSLSRKDLLAVAHDYMLTAMLEGRSIVPRLTLGGQVPEPDTLQIDHWMGASPNYTRRLREVFGIDGDDVAAIMKALQLDLGFVHGYMDVGYRIDRPDYGEFWLNHCGALMDVEPLGEDRVFNMCHTIEDPTFDATALATNPKARIRPIHRPPRVPADRHPHCHWTLAIDEENEPIGPIAHTDRVGALALASVPNEIGPAGEGGRLHDYSGDFEPGFRLADLTSAAVAAAAREFQVQVHLLAASLHLTVADRSSEEIAREGIDDGWATFGWVVADRLSRAISLGRGVDAVVRALELTPVFPPGFDRTVTRHADRLTATFEPAHEGMLDPDHPGWVGSLARGVTTGVEGTIRGLGFETEDAGAVVDDQKVVFEVSATPAGEDREVPDWVRLCYDVGRAATWSFESLVEL